MIRLILANFIFWLVIPAFGDALNDEYGLIARGLCLIFTICSIIFIPVYLAIKAANRDRAVIKKKSAIQ